MNQPDPLESELIEECGELLRSLKTDIPKIWEHLLDPEILERMHRSAHTARGLIGFLGIEEMSGIASRLTETLRTIRDGDKEVTEEAVDEIRSDTSKLSDLLAPLAKPGGESADEAVAGAVTQPMDALVTEFDRTAIIQPGERLSGRGSCPSPSRAASDFGAEVGALSRAIDRVFSDFGIQGTAIGKDRVGEFGATTRDLTAVVDPKGDLGAAIFFAFDSDVAGALAARVAASTVGDEVAPPDGEETEFVSGMLGEIVSLAVLETLKALALSPEFAAPRFVDRKGAQLSPTPLEAMGITVTTPLGEFEAGFVPGSSILEIPESSRARSDRTAYRKKVVIADDSAVMRKTIERALLQGGYEVVAQASNGREAIEEFRRHRPDLLVLDICMPVMGGLDALKVIHAEDPAARVLISSSIGDRAVVRRGFQAGAVGYITKPFKPDLLLEIVGSLFKRPEPGEEPSAGQGPKPLRIPTLGIYRVGRPLGEGGMATVYEGFDPSLNRKVALKVIRDQYAGDVEFVVRFLEEARAVARVSHPNVVSIYSAGSDRGKHFFAMELLPGPDLASLVRRRGPLPPEEAIRYLRQAALGLRAALREDLIHCDIKPSNLLLGSDGLVEVTDFGIAQSAGTNENSSGSEVLGTPSYMAPEQVMQETLDHRTDIYSLGATLYFLLIGEVPYSGEEAVEIALQHVEGPVPLLPMKLDRLNPLLTTMMAKDPEARHADYDELLARIDGLV